MPEDKTYHLSPSDFRRLGHAAIDWIADYYERVESLPVLSRVKPGEIRASLPAHPPATGEPFDAVLKDLDELILPGITHWQSPNFFAYFPANNSGPSILGDLLSSGLGVQGMLWATSPACTELETHVLDWMAEMLGLPAELPVRRARRRRDPGLRLERRAVRPARRPRARHRACQQRARLRRPAGRLRLDPGPFVHREGVPRSPASAGRTCA